MEANKNPEEFYAKLKNQLADTAIWPSPYLFKFIVPTDQDKIDQVSRLFDHLGAIVDTKASRKGTYTSVSIHVKMKNPDAVIEKYKEASNIEGIISL